MARPRKSLRQLELSGTLAAHPGRYAERTEPVVTEPLGEPPAGLSSEAAAHWRTIAAAGEWLTAADRAMVEIAARLFADFRAGDTSTLRQLTAALGKLGFSPAERERIGV